MPTNQFLVVIDFDHTITSKNTDTWVLESLLPEPKVKQLNSLRHSEKTTWQQFMRSGFQALHVEKISHDQIIQAMQEIPLVEGIEQFLQHIGRHDECKVIIASDSNTIFIDAILKKHGLDNCIHEVCTNPARFDDDDLLHLLPHHSHSCPTCEPNICKQEIVRHHLQKEKEKGHVYERIFVIGDGGNDFCPCKLLGKNDCIFPRKGYRLIKKIDALKKAGSCERLEAPVVTWENGEDLLFSFGKVTGLKYINSGNDLQLLKETPEK